MENKKLGGVIIAISVVAAIIAFSFMGVLGRQTASMQCYPTNECQRVQSLMSLSHISVGLISFIGALGVYLLFFSTSEEAILRRLEEDKNRKLDVDKFELIMKSMDQNEQNVLKAIKEQDGITQSTLKFRADLSKAKISQILSDFERKNLVRRELKGKTYAVYLAQNF
jgi:uncharacterized membrane protein